MQQQPTAIPERDQIVETARQLFNDKGFDQTTIDDVLHQLDMDQHGFSRHFQSLDEILEVIWSGR